MLELAQVVFGLSATVLGEDFPYQLGTGGPAAYIWDFGDGRYATVARTDDGPVLPAEALYETVAPEPGNNFLLRLYGFVSDHRQLTGTDFVQARAAAGDAAAEQLDTALDKLLHAADRLRSDPTPDLAVPVVRGYQELAGLVNTALSAPPAIEPGPDISDVLPPLPLPSPVSPARGGSRAQGASPGPGALSPARQAALTALRTEVRDSQLRAEFHANQAYRANWQREGAVRPVPGDGDCFWHAFVHAFAEQIRPFLPAYQPVDVYNVRQYVRSTLEADFAQYERRPHRPDLYPITFLLLQMVPEGDAEDPRNPAARAEYLRTAGDMRRWNTPAGGLMLPVVLHIFGVAATVLHLNQAIHVGDPDLAPSGYLHHRPGHWDPVDPHPTTVGIRHAAELNTTPAPLQADLVNRVRGFVADHDQVLAARRAQPGVDQADLTARHDELILELNRIDDPDRPEASYGRAIEALDLYRGLAGDTQPAAAVPPRPRDGGRLSPQWFDAFEQLQDQIAADATQSPDRDTADYQYIRTALGTPRPVAGTGARFYEVLIDSFGAQIRARLREAELNATNVARYIAEAFATDVRTYLRRDTTRPDTPDRYPITHMLRQAGINIDDAQRAALLATDPSYRIPPGDPMINIAMGALDLSAVVLYPNYPDRIGHASTRPTRYLWHTGDEFQAFDTASPGHIRLPEELKAAPLADPDLAERVAQFIADDAALSTTDFRRAQSLADPTTAARLELLRDQHHHAVDQLHTQPTPDRLTTALNTHLALLLDITEQLNQPTKTDPTTTPHPGTTTTTTTTVADPSTAGPASTTVPDPSTAGPATTTGPVRRWRQVGAGLWAPATTPVTTDPATVPDPSTAGPAATTDPDPRTAGPAATTDQDPSTAGPAATTDQDPSTAGPAATTDQDPEHRRAGRHHRPRPEHCRLDGGGSGGGSQHVRGARWGPSGGRACPAVARIIA